MTHIQIQLEEQHYQALRALAAHRRVTVAELLCEAIDLLLRTKHDPVISTDDRRHRAIAAAGCFHTGLSDLAENHDAYLAQAYGETL
jgi:hypothetical protein